MIAPGHQEVPFAGKEQQRPASPSSRKHAALLPLTRVATDRAERRQIQLLVVAGLACAWLTLSAAILEVMTALIGVPSLPSAILKAVIEIGGVR